MDKANRRYNDMRDDYEARLSKLREEILTLRQVVDSQRRDISHLESVVRMMRRIKGIEWLRRQSDLGFHQIIYNFSGNVLELTLTNYKFVWFEIYKW